MLRGWIKTRGARIGGRKEMGAALGGVACKVNANKRTSDKLEGGAREQRVIAARM